MEWLLQKAIESSGHSYSPQQVFETLNSHVDAIKLLNNTLAIVLVLWLGLAIYTSLSYYKFDKRLKKLENLEK